VIEENGMLLQGLILMVAGVSIVFLFLCLLVAVLTVSAKIIPRFNHILPDGQMRFREHQPERPDAKAPKHVFSPDEEIAAAVAAATARQRSV